MAPKKALLLACGSFNPPTNMHLRLFGMCTDCLLLLLSTLKFEFEFDLSELAKDHLRTKGVEVLGGIISPVNDAYQKKDLLPAQHRTKMVELAVQKYDFVRCSKWEAEQSQWIRTRNVLDEYKNQVCVVISTNRNLKVHSLMLLLIGCSIGTDRHWTQLAAQIRARRQRRTSTVILVVWR